VLCSKSLSSEAEDEAVEGFIVEVQFHGIEVLLGGFLRTHKLLPFSTPQSYTLLSAESKVASAANNKERLGEYHFE
jgi:hypothetical protein